MAPKKDKGQKDARHRPTMADSARPARSRLDRPCDLCRRHKHMCMLPVRGEPCVSCRTRGVACTFDMGPTARNRSKKESTVGTEDQNAVEHGDRSMDAGPSQAQHPGLSQDAPLPSIFSNNFTQLASTSPTLATSYTSSSLPNISNVIDQSTVHSQSHTNLNSRAIPIPINQSGVRDEPYLSTPRTAPTAVAGLSFEYADPSLSPLAAASAGWSDGAADEPIAHPPSLDLEESTEQESHYVGAGAFSALGLGATQPPPSSGATGTLSFRQVSSDPRHPVFFLKNPTLLYGRTPNTGQGMFEAAREICDQYGRDVLSRAITQLNRVTLPALPILNAKRLETSCLGLEGSGPIPYGLLTGILAHAAHLIPDIRPLHNQLWRSALLVLDDEYRLPRLSTLQLALLPLCSRPEEHGENAGQLTIAMARAAGAAHLLGLHMDPTDWMLPQWEINLRKRIWWALYFQDKWRSLLYGRPSNFQKGNHRVRLPTVEDGDWGRWATPSDRISLETFVATCRMTLVVDQILAKFYTVDAVLEPLPALTRIAELEDMIKQLKELEASLSPPIRLSNERSILTLPTGVRSFQLMYLGLIVIIRRLLFECLPVDAIYSSLILQSAYAACHDVVTFMGTIQPADEGLYWSNYSWHHIANAASLLLRLAMRSRKLSGGQDPLELKAIEQITYLVNRLIDVYNRSRWDVVTIALRRIAGLLLMAEIDLPDVRGTYRQVAQALGMPIAGETDTADEFLASLGLTDFDPLGWMGNDRSWFPTFGGLFDLEGNGNGMGSMGGAFANLDGAQVGSSSAGGGAAAGGSTNMGMGMGMGIGGFDDALYGGMSVDGMGTMPGSGTGMSGL